MDEGIDDGFELIKNYMKKLYGINLTGEKRALVYSRLRSTMSKLKINALEDYYSYLISDETGLASSEFINKMTTNHTFFMREVTHFEYLKNIVLPELKAKNKNKDIRIWCAGCSSGEEAYTLQMIMTEFFEDDPNWDTELLATDISSDVLQKAKDGIYPKDKIKALPKNWQKKYFKKFDSNNMVVKDFIKKKITYRNFNLMKEKFPFRKKFQIIFCRNVMIYFDDESRTKLINKFYENSEKGAHLFIGHAETLNNIKSKYKYVTPAVYIKN